MSQHFHQDPEKEKAIHLKKAFGTSLRAREILGVIRVVQHFEYCAPSLWSNLRFYTRRRAAQDGEINGRSLLSKASGSTNSRALWV
jgi:hypothetical protein